MAMQTARIMPSVPLIGDIVVGAKLPRMGDINLQDRAENRQLPKMGDTPITGGAHLGGKHPDKGNMIDVMA